MRTSASMPGKSLRSNGGWLDHVRSSSTSAEIEHDGQIVAMVVADSFEAAREAAHKVESRLRRRAAERELRFDRPSRTGSGKRPSCTRPQVGDTQAALRRGARQDRRANTARRPQHHNPIELFTTTAPGTATS